MLPTTMNTVEMTGPGNPDVLVPGTRPLPVPAAGEVLIKVTAAGVNGPDMVQRRGHYPPPEGASDLLGVEVSGEIVAVGEGVATSRTGEKVCALTNGGGYAEYVAVDAGHCLVIPQGVSERDAAGLPETFFTVWSNLFYQHEPQPGSVLLVHGGAGGIGSTAVQLGTRMGMRVFATCANADDCAYVESLGAERAIDYTREDFVEIVRAAGGAALILDIIGGGYVARNFKAAAHDGHIVQLAFNAGSKVEINLMPVMLKRLTYTGSTLRSRPSSFKADVARALQERVWPWFADGSLQAQTHEVFPFSKVRDAHQMMETAGHRGKILLQPDH